MTMNKVYNSNITIRINKDDKDKFKDKVDIYNITMSEVIREAIESYLNKESIKLRAIYISFIGGFYIMGYYGRVYG